MSFDAVRLGTSQSGIEAIRHSLIPRPLKRATVSVSRLSRRSASCNLLLHWDSRGVCSCVHRTALEIGSLQRRIAKLAEPNDQTDEKERISLAARVRALTETFFDIARDLYDFLEDVTPAVALEHLEQTMMQEHEVRSLDAVKRLRQLIMLSEEWLNALRSPGGNFVEFLAKSRTVVAGTCVGIGYRGAGHPEYL